MHRLKHFLWAGLFAAAASLGAAERTVDFEQLTMGKVPPVLDGGELFFGNVGAAARVPGVFDLTKGIRVEVEFLNSGTQTNDYPRLFEIKGFSLQFNNRAGSQIKIYSSLEKGKYAQALLTIPPQPGVWQKAVVTLEPGNQRLTIQVGDDPKRFKTAPLSVDIGKLTAVPMILGGERLNNAGRGFSGKLRNLKITAPYDPAPSPPAAKAEPRRINGEPVSYVRVAATPGHHYAFPGLVRLANGDLMAVFREGVGHVCPYGRHTACFSKDNGRTWSAPLVINDTPTDDRDPSLRQLADGRLLLAYFRNNAWIKTRPKLFATERAFVQQAGAESDAGRFFRFSEDGGRTWGPEVRVPCFTPHGPVVLDGHFYIPTSISRDGRRYVDFYRGSLDGLKWEKIGVVGGSENTAGESFQEPHTAVLPDGTFVTAIRVAGDGFMRISFSTDRGRTWSEPVKTEVRGFPQHLLVLKDGRLLATYGYRFQPRGIRACISKDGGKTWDMANEMIIRDDGVTYDLGYPESIELDGGEVMTVYYHNSPEIEDCHIEVAVYKP